MLLYYHSSSRPLPPRQGPPYWCHGQRASLPATGMLCRSQHFTGPYCHHTTLKIQACSVCYGSQFLYFLDGRGWYREQFLVEFFFFFNVCSDIRRDANKSAVFREEKHLSHYSREQGRGHHKMAQRSASHTFPSHTKSEDPLTEMLI